MDAPLLKAAVEATPARAFASPELTGAAGAPGIGSLTEVLVALAVVLGAIFLFAALVRRLRGLSGSGAAAIRVISEVQLGPKERAVLIETGDAQLLLGVAPGRVATLHVFPAGTVSAEARRATEGGTTGSASNPFRELMQRFGGAR